MDEGRRRRRVRLADAMLLATIVGFATTMALIGMAPADRVAQIAVVGFPEGLVLPVPWLASAIAGAIIVRRQPANLIGWACSAGGFVPVLIALSVGIATYLLALDVESRPGQVVAWISHIGSVMLFAPAFLIMFRYPSGRALGPRSARLERLWAGMFGVLLLTAAVAPLPIVGFIGLSNPFGVEGVPRSVFLGLLAVTISVLLTAGGSTLVTRYRQGSWHERRQIGLLGGAAALVVADVATIPVTSPQFASTGQLSFATYFTSTLALTSIPVAIGIAVVRYHLYDIDLIVKRTLVYGVVSAVLFGVYLAAVLVLQGPLGTVVPGEAETLATAASTLLVAGLFRPVRDRAQRAIDRRFDRERYEARRTIEAFAGDVRDEVELEAILRDFLAATARTVHPASAACWIRGRQA